MDKDLILVICAICGAVGSIVTIAVVGFSMIHHLSNLNKNSAVMVEAVSNMKIGIEEFKDDFKVDSDRQWRKLNEHETSIASLKVQVGRGVS